MCKQKKKLKIGNSKIVKPELFIYFLIFRKLNSRFSLFLILDSLKN